MFLPQKHFKGLIMPKTIGLYIHIPFCKSKCPYCDFYSSRATELDFDKYTEVLIDKIKLWSSKTKCDVATVYFGGGTPSVLGAERLCKILSSIKNSFNIIYNAEITVEVNPDTGKTIDFDALYNVGFNRLSIGLQSAVGEELKALGRIHTSEEAKITVERAKTAGFENISLDLMMGIPHQTKESLKKSIEFCVECGVKHISSYILKIETGTKYDKIKDKLILPDDDTQAELYLYAVDLFSQYGFNQYEISNFAKSDFESKHNINYWNCGEYIGIGPSAHSFFEGKRFYYERNMDDFINNKSVFDCYGGNEEEFIMLSLRLKNGLSFAEFKNKFGKDISQKLIDKAKMYAKSGFMSVDSEKICFTPKGFLVSNTIISDLI